MTWHVWTDGSCQHGYAQVEKGLRGWGGWCAIVEHGSDGAVLRGRVAKTTNVRMELHAVTEGLRAVPDGASVLVHTDSTVIVTVRDWVDRQHRNSGNRSRSDHRYWDALADQLERVDARVHLLGRGVRDPIHKRAHTIAGAEARGGLRNLPVNATPLEEDHHRIRKGMRRVATSERMLHARECEVGRCVRSCPIWLQYGPALR